MGAHALARIYHDQGHFTRAEETCFSGLGADNDTLKTMNNLALVYLQQGHYEEALYNPTSLRFTQHMIPMSVCLSALPVVFLGSHLSEQAGHVAIPFTAGYEDVSGQILKLDHIADPRIRPLDELLRDRFSQCVLKNMKGAGELTWDYEAALGGGRMDLSNNLWSGKDGLAHRLHSLRIEQESSSLLKIFLFSQ